jgi:hypothetical protein
MGWLLSCDDDALVGGSNLAVLGSEVIQFGGAQPLGGGRFRLSRLLRGRAGTEWAMDAHSAGEAFALIDPDALRTVVLPSWAMGAGAVASLVGQGSESSGPTPVAAEALRPPSPVALLGEIDAAGQLVLRWTRRSRRGFAWDDEIDVPLGEASERYRVTIEGASRSLEYESSEPALVVSAADMTVIGPGPAIVEVRQIGDAAASRPASLNLTIQTGANA